MSNLIYSINATLPIFLLIILGKVLKTTKIINDEFTKTADRYVFRIALPALLFSDLIENNVGSAFDGKYVLFCFSVTIFSIAVLWGLTEKFMKNEEQKGAFIQGSYRSSAAILGLAFINNMYDSVGMAPLMIIGCVPLYNIFAVIILTLKGDNGGKKPNMKETFINVMKNMSVDCDCVAHPAAVDMKDIGILASLNPVALDQACVDLVYKAPDSHSLVERIQSRNGELILEHAQKIGLGERRYRLVCVD